MSGQVASMQQQNIFGNQLGLNMPQIGLDMPAQGQAAPYMLAAPKLEVPTIGAAGLQPMGGMEMDANFGMQPVSLDMNQMGLGGNFVFYPEADVSLGAEYEPVGQEEELAAPKSPAKTRDATVLTKEKPKKPSQGFCCF